MVKILKTQQQNDLNPETGGVISRMRVTWQVDAQHGPYIDFFDAATFDGAAAKAAIEKRAAEIMKLKG